MIEHGKLPAVYLARHCKTRYNEEHRIQGTLNIPLSKEGRIQARNIAQSVKKLGIKRIISSPSMRALETAKIYADHAEARLCTDDRLRELDHGTWQGKRIDELLDDPSSEYEHWLRNPLSIRIPNGTESVILAQSRMIGAIRDIVRKYDNTILILTHKHIKAILQCALLGIPLIHFRTQIDENIEPVEIPARQIRSILADKLFENQSTSPSDGTDS